jgi:hypothetical protein
LGALASGGVPVIVTEGHGQDELEKRISAAVLQGSQVILLDNLQRKLVSSTLESLLTELAGDLRKFGKLELLSVLCRALIIATANNASIRVDLLRRSLPVRIVVESAKPELRRFGFDPAAEVLRDRQELLSAVFTIVLAWMQVRERPENQEHHKPLGSFEAWAELVAAPVSWLTSKSPVDLIEERKDREQTESTEQHVFAALATWQADLVDEEGKHRDTWKAEEAAASLDPALWPASLHFKGERPSGVQLGHWLRKYRDTVFDDLILSGTQDPHTKLTMWSLREMRVSAEFPTPLSPDSPDGLASGCPPTLLLTGRSEVYVEEGGFLYFHPSRPTR